VTASFVTWLELTDSYFLLNFILNNFHLQTHFAQKVAQKFLAFMKSEFSALCRNIPPQNEVPGSNTGLETGYPD
jgi:hypothetical protein